MFATFVSGKRLGDFVNLMYLTVIIACILAVKTKNKLCPKRKYIYK